MIESWLIDRLNPRKESVFEEGTPIDEPLNQAVRESVPLHRRLGLPMTFWREGKVVSVDPEDDPNEREFNHEGHEEHKGERKPEGSLIAGRT